MPEKWTGEIVGRMHVNRVTLEELGKEVGATKSYVSMILNGKRKAVGWQEKLEAGLDRILERRCSVAG